MVPQEKEESEREGRDTDDKCIFRAAQRGERLALTIYTKYSGVQEAGGGMRERLTTLIN